MARKQAKRELRDAQPVVIGAGLTEKRYFEHLKKLREYKVSLRPRFFGRDNASTMDHLVKATLSDGITAICVFDMDATQWDGSEKKRLAEFIKTYKNNPSVVICGSMPSIEYWFLLHYKDTHKAFRTSDDVIKELNKFIPDFEKTDHFLKHIHWVSDMIADGRMDLAVERSKNSNTSEESYTDIWKAIEFLEKKIVK